MPEGGGSAMDRAQPCSRTPSANRVRKVRVVRAVHLASIGTRRENLAQTRQPSISPHPSYSGDNPTTVGTCPDSVSPNRMIGKNSKRRLAPGRIAFCHKLYEAAPEEPICTSAGDCPITSDMLLARMLT